MGGSEEGRNRRRVTATTEDAEELIALLVFSFHSHLLPSPCKFVDSFPEAPELMQTNLPTRFVARTRPHPAHKGTLRRCPLLGPRLVNPRTLLESTNPSPTQGTAATTTTTTYDCHLFREVVVVTVLVVVVAPGNGNASKVHHFTIDLVKTYEAKR